MYLGNSEFPKAKYTSVIENGKWKTKLGVFNFLGTL
jgi:hypothetical protein